MLQQPESNSSQKVPIREDINIENASVLESQIGQAGRDLHQIQYVTVYEKNLSVASLFRKPVKSTSQQDYRFRKILLNKVKQDWIKGVLEKSLHCKALIELGLQERLDTVERSVSQVLEGAECDRLLPSGTTASHLFTEMGEGRTLLILGEPGAGKTTILLKLAQDLIAQTEADLSQPIPVIFNLSSWATKRQAISEWLIQELNGNYQVSKSLGRSWIKEQQLLLLLDGLDEVKIEHREACVQALNQFIEQYGQTEMVVCSRIRDYEALSARLKLRGSICVQSLTPEQINQYLNQAGKQLEAIKRLLKEDSALQELARSPLMLNIITVAYHSLSSEELPQHSLIEERRQHLFNTYIERMFRRKLVKEQYAKDRAMNWLIWLSHKMVQESQTVFLIERIQPTWLNNKLQKIIYKSCTFLMAIAVSLIISLLTSIALLFLLMPLVLIFSQSDGQLNSLVPFIKTAWDKALSEGSILGLAYGLVIVINQDRIQPIDSLKWSWSEIRKSGKSGLIVGLISGSGIGLIKGLYAVQNPSPMPAPSMGIFSGVFAAINTGIIYCLIQGLKGGKIKAQSFPNQSIWESGKNALILGAMGGLIAGIVAIAFMLLMSPQMTISNQDLILGFIGATAFGTPVGLIFGGIGVCIKHFTLRVIIYCSKYIPWNYARFLDYATERIFLQKVGGGYLFIHRMLLEHFAKMEIKA